MVLLPAHQRLLDDDVEEELTDDQIRDMLENASQRIQQDQGTGVFNPDTPLQLPKLSPGHITDAIITTKGSVTRLHASNLVDQRDRSLANSIKKIEDPIATRKKRQEVRFFFWHSSFANDDNYPKLH